MRLYVTNNLIEDCPMDVIQMSVFEFNSLSNHPFIASHRFDAIVVDVTSSLNFDMLIPLMSTTRVIPKFNKVDNTLISLLCTLFKDKAALLRYNFIRDKEKCTQIVEDMRKEFNWDNY